MSTKERVAIVGAGPGGLAAAKFLLAHGFEPVLFEQSDSLGGLWNQGAPHSGAWPAMPTNTSWVTTQFSDLPWPPGAPMFLHNRDVLGYLRKYSDQFGVSEHIRLNTRVQLIECAGSGNWQITSVTGGTTRTETFARVVVAPGRFSCPMIPEVPGLDTFPGTIEHTFQYRSPEDYPGKRVLVAGCSISAAEIAPELAIGGAARVISCMRRQRYVLQRIVAGVPVDLLIFTRFGALAAERLPQEVRSRYMKEFIVRTSGVPEQWGGRVADPDPFVAGLTVGHFYLPLVAERRIIPRPWIHSISGDRITFEDGSEEEVDTILFATGFRTHLPFCSDGILEKIGRDDHALRLYRHTFHPELPGLAFLGLFHMTGPYFPPLELQARWITYVWAGLSPEPRRETMTQEIQAQKPVTSPISMPELCVSLARDAGIEPDMERWPDLKRALLFGPLSPISFRLSGPDALADAPNRFAEEAAQFGAITSPEFTQEELAKVRALEQARATVA